MDAAIKVLRERGALKAAKREGRTAAEGLAAVKINDAQTAGVVVELNSETDFVARNEEFQALSESIAALALEKAPADLEGLLALPMGGGTVQSAVSDIQAKIGEKIELSSYGRLEGGLVAGYVHPPGKIGVLVSADIAGGDKAAGAETLKDVAMHIAAFAPRFLDRSSVDEATVEAEKEIFATQARNEGKPENIIPRIVEGKVKSFYKDNCVVDQPFAKDADKTVAQVVQGIHKDAKLTGLRRVAVGSK
jgi:elongation factor Ts